MKNVAISKVFIIAVLSVTAFSCSKSSSSKNNSRATGWQINSKDGGFQYNTNFREQETSPGLVFIEGGTFTKGRVQDDVMHDWNNAPSQQHVQSFYMDETEVTNLMYVEYLDYTKRLYSPEDDFYKNIYPGILPDTLVWRNRLGYNEVMTENYLRHPAYAEYPVVGVSWIQATLYSKWRTDRVNELNLEKTGYRDINLAEQDPENPFSTERYKSDPSALDNTSDDGRKNKNARVDKDGNETGVYASVETGVLGPSYRLPTETEWEYAALGLSELRSYNLYRGRKKYPWDGQYTRSGKRKYRGDQLANFKQAKGDYGGIAGWSDDGADITNAVKSYAPNDYGLYDMAGNVAEWVADVYRPIIDDEFNDFNYYRGNVYTKNEINEDGSIKVITSEEIIYDTLPNGKIIARNLPGEIAKVPVDEKETYLRPNFDRADNINFRDGDRRSSRNFERFGEDENDDENSKSNSETRKMYNSPKHKVTRDSLGNIIREYDKSNNRTSLINDEVRVYKGGSWKDREYWLDPAQRRYFPQDMATDYIGFRCAMSRLGSKSKMKQKKRS